MRELLVALPTAVLVTAAAACLIAWRSVRTQRVIALAAMACLVALAGGLLVVVTRSGPLSLAVGSWSAPIGIVFRADLLASVMTLTAAVIGFSVALYAVSSVAPEDEGRGFWPLTLLLVMGVCGAFLTHDLFNLYVWFEVLLVASFVLLALGNRPAQLRATHVYLLLNTIGSMTFLIGVGLTYASVQSLDMTQISERMGELSSTQPGTVLAIQATLLIAFGIKAAVFPLMFWLPASYHTPSPAVSALFTALLTKVGVYAMIRITTDVFPDTPSLADVLSGVAIATMFVGVLGALAQSHLRRLLSFHIVSQIGYMIAGLAIAIGPEAPRQLAIAATLFFLLHNIFAKASLFLVAGIVRHVRGTEKLDQLGGMARGYPLLAGLFLVAALALAGMPPLSGLWGKLAIMAAGLEADRPILVASAMAVSLLTLISMIKIWLHVFVGRSSEASGPHAVHRRVPPSMYAATAILVAIVLALSVAPDLLFQLGLRAADQLAAIPQPPIWSGGAP